MHRLILSLLATIGLLTSCNLYPGSDARTDTLDMVSTLYDDQIDFKSMQTYALYDDVVPIVEDGSTPNFTITAEIKNTILSSIEANLAAYGWQKVDTTDNPDLIFGSGITVTVNTNIYQSFPIYGWGYPYYGYTVSSYPVGNLIIVALDHKDRDTVTNVAPTVWFGLIQGPLTGGVSDPMGRLDRDISQAFEQSTYLNLNP